MKNPFGKKREVSNPYAIYRDDKRDFEYRVLKSYQSRASEIKKPQRARWHLATLSPYTFGSWEYGDCYVNQLLGSAAVLVDGSDMWKKIYGH